MSALFAPQTLTSGSTTLNVTRDSSVANGTYLLTIVASAAGITRTTGVVVTTGLSLDCGINIDNPFGSGMGGQLSATDAASIHRPGSFADYCSFTLVSERPLTMNMTSGWGNGYFYLLSTTGEILKVSDAIVTGDPGLQIVLPAGTYVLEATSQNPGEYGIMVFESDIDTPQVHLVVSEFGVAGNQCRCDFYRQKLSRRFVPAGNRLLPRYGCFQHCRAELHHGKGNIHPSNSGKKLLHLRSYVGGMSSPPAKFDIIPPTPTLTSVSPNFVIQGQSVLFTLTGTNFISPEVHLRSPQGTLSPVTERLVNATTITVDMNFSLSSVPGVYSFLVTTSGGISNAVTFTLAFAPPSLRSIYPPAGGPGLSQTVVLEGTSFGSPFQINVSPHITVTNVTLVNLSRIEATFSVSPDAPLGDYPITVTTAAGTTQSVIYKVMPPPVITSAKPSRAFIGRTTTVVLTGTDFVCGCRCHDGHQYGRVPV
jgi:hypothetical protein